MSENTIDEVVAGARVLTDYLIKSFEQEGEEFALGIVKRIDQALLRIVLLDTTKTSEAALEIAELVAELESKKEE